MTDGWLSVDNGTSAASATKINALEITKLIPVPSAPSGLTATAVSFSQINLTWTDNATNETGFQIERSPDGSAGWTQIATPAANAISFADTGLSAGTPYYYRLRATNGGGNSAYTITTGTTTLNGVQSFRAAYGLASDGSQDTATPAGDGVSHILKYAFNMLGSGTGQASSLTTPNAATLTTNGSAGLPMGLVDSNRMLQITYIRRKASTNPAITYAAEFSNDLGLSDPWAVNGSASEQITSIDATFERVTITDSITPVKRFVRVRITTN